MVVQLPLENSKQATLIGAYSLIITVTGRILRPQSRTGTREIRSLFRVPQPKRQNDDNDD